MTTAPQDNGFEEDQDPADEPTEDFAAPQDPEPTVPKQKNIIHIDDIIADADERDRQREAEGKMSIGRYHDISSQIADGQDPELSVAEQAKYDETHEQMQELGRNLTKKIIGPNSDMMKSIMAPYANINKKLAESIAKNVGIQNAFNFSNKPIIDFQAKMKPKSYEVPELYNPPHALTSPKRPAMPDYAQLFDNSEQLKSIEEANEARNKREEADRQVAAAHLEATQQMVQAALAESEKAEAREIARQIEAKKQEASARRRNTALTVIAGLTLLGTVISVIPTIAKWFTG